MTKQQSGVEAVAEMLNQLEPAERQKMLENIAARDPVLAKKIQDKLFIFENLLTFEDALLQLVLKEIPQPVLALALRAASDELKGLVFRNLTKRAAEAVQEEIASSAPRKLSEVREAQKKIAEIAQSIAELKGG
mgnify:CR=1 FL=1